MALPLTTGFLLTGKNEQKLLWRRRVAAIHDEWQGQTIDSNSCYLELESVLEVGKENRPAPLRRHSRESGNPVKHKKFQFWWGGHLAQSCNFFGVAAGYRLLAAGCPNGHPECLRSNSHRRERQKPFIFSCGFCAVIPILNRNSINPNERVGWGRGWAKSAGVKRIGMNSRMNSPRTSRPRQGRRCSGRKRALPAPRRAAAVHDERQGQ